jgi:hypothetical protein
MPTSSVGRKHRVRSTRHACVLGRAADREWRLPAGKQPTEDLRDRIFQQQETERVLWESGLSDLAADTASVWR